jgi:hypothetical protein
VNDPRRSTSPIGTRPERSSRKSVFSRRIRGGWQIDCYVYDMTEDKAIYFQDPSFRYAVLQVIIQRLMESYARYTNRTSLSAHMFGPMRFPHARFAHYF